MAIVSNFIPILAIILYSRAVFGFTSATFFQPRYLFPIFLVILSIALMQVKNSKAIFSSFQYILLSAMVLIGSILSWQAITTRYTIGPMAVYTNFGQKIEWWPFPDYLSRLDVFFLSLLIHSIWIYFTIITWGSKRKHKSPTG